MKNLVFVITAALAVLAGIKQYQNTTTNKPQFTRFLAGPNLTQIKHDSWSAWKILHEKTYFTNFEEDFRKKIFLNNLSVVIKHNSSEDKKYTMKLNHFADITDEEFKVSFTGLIKSKREKKLRFSFFGGSERSELPKRVDWREKNAVTDIKNQGGCGSCYSFSSTGAIEGLQAIKENKLISLSEQQLVDCSFIYGNVGCGGGMMDNSFKYIMEYGIQSEESYPYKFNKGECVYNKNKVVTKINNFVDVPEDDQFELAHAVAKQPVSVGIDANSVRFYHRGVFDDWNCSENLNHAVLVVGYGTEDGKDYWLVKNTWGKAWGELGYFKLAKKDTGKGICGITAMPSYPVLKDEVMAISE